jgi:hypothetical protein
MRSCARSQVSGKQPDMRPQGTTLMDIIGPKTYLAHEFELRAIRGDHWVLENQQRLVFHALSGVMFFIEFADDADYEGAVKLTHITARAVHICDGKEMPEPDLMERLGKDAIHVFALLADLMIDWAPLKVQFEEEDAEDDGLPF